MKNKLIIIIVLTSVMLLYCVLAHCWFGVVCMVGALISGVMAYQSYMGE
jgi:hypothetical protein